MPPVEELPPVTEVLPMDGWIAVLPFTLTLWLPLLAIAVVVAVIVFFAST